MVLGEAADELALFSCHAVPKALEAMGFEFSYPRDAPLRFGLAAPALRHHNVGRRVTHMPPGSRSLPSLHPTLLCRFNACCHK